MGTTTETRITSTQAKDAIYKAHLSKDAIEKIEGLQASASEIDGLISKKSSPYKNILNWNEQVSPNIVSNSYLDTSGVVKTLVGFIISSFIPAVEGKKYYHITQAMTTTMLGGYYDSNYVWIGNIVKHKTAPLNTAYIRINIHLANDFGKMLLFEEKTTIEPLVYKKIAFIGDSITEGYPNTQLAATDIYPALIKEELGLETAYNFGISGTHLVGSHYGDGATRRFWNVNEDVEAVVVFMGVNDFLHFTDTAPIGTITDTDDSTFYGGINFLIKGLIRRFFGKQILFVTPLRCSQEANINTTTGLNLQGYVDIIKERCEYYSIPYVDLFNEARIDPKNEWHYNMYTFDGLHPNKYGHRIIAEKILRGLILN